ncbi:hypothetical protein CesoFtcFv8_025217 [Champsocephalus esox]|uniref:Leucine-rich repeat-containing protein 14 n=1 Tax=Champsocephalus esox TaxID=159716 RepID=A0AAN8B3C7_9TELE|nr:hypothetical protein CesoFtcFv8_025217 [Champsocephalus esox]
MVLSLLSLCASEVVRDHSSSPCWLSFVPMELFRPLLEASLSGCRPLAVGELVQRWPERTLRVRRKPAPNRLCIQALLLAVARGLLDHRCALQVLDLCGLQGDEGGDGGHDGRLVPHRGPLHHGAAGQERSPESAEGEEEEEGREEGEGRRTRASVILNLTGEEELTTTTCGISSEDELIRGVRRRMEAERKMMPTATESGSKQEVEEDSEVLVHVRADLFVNARSWERVRGALTTCGPLKLQCRYLRAEEISVSSIRALLALLPQQGLLGLDVRYSNIGVAGLAELLPLLKSFPALSSLRKLSEGLKQLQELRCLSLTALRLPGQLRVLLSSLPRPLEVLELPYLSLSPADLAFLSVSHHASTLQQLDLSENRLDETTLTSIRRLLSQASSTLQHLSLSGCGLTDNLLVLLLPSLGCCRALRSLALALNPLSVSGLMDLVKMAVKMPSLRQLLYPNPLEDYQPGLPEMPSSAQLLDWPLDEAIDVNITSSQINRALKASGRSDLLLTCDLLNYDKDMVC